jgi:hypothetical protein
VQIILDVSPVERSISGKFTATSVTTQSRCSGIEALDSCLIVRWRMMSVPRSHRNCFVPRQFLYRSKIHILHRQSADKRMAQIMPEKVLDLCLFQRQLKPLPRIVHRFPVFGLEASSLVPA